MPDLIGKKASPVISRLKTLEFNLGDIRYTYYPGLGKDVIINNIRLKVTGFRREI